MWPRGQEKKFAPLRDHRLVFLAGLFVALYGVELALVEIKFRVIGNAQLYHGLDTFFEIFTFLAVGLILDLFVLGALYAVWNALLRSLGVRSFLILFHFVAIVAITTGVTFALEYELHTYFSDAINSQVLSVMAGGSLKSAIFYVSDELSIIVIGALLACAAYGGLHLLARFWASRIPARPFHMSDWFPGRRSFAVTAILLPALLGAMILAIDQAPDVRYNLDRKISYRLFKWSLGIVTDFDGDGASWFTRPADPAPFDASIHPGALDIPDNGIDENGFAGDFSAAPAPAGLPAVPVLAGDFRHIVLVVIESARADMIGKRLDGRLVAPNLTSLAQEGSHFPLAFSHVGYTESSLLSLFTGYPQPTAPGNSLFYQLKTAGFGISVFSGQDEDWGNLSRYLGTKALSDTFFDARVGVDRRVFPSTLPINIKVAEATLLEEFSKAATVIDWQTPQFIYFNMQAGHFPYFHKSMDRVFVEEGISRSQIGSRSRDWLQATYWNAMAYADSHIGAIEAKMKELGVWDDTLLVVVGDHGESLFDDGYLGHGHFISDTQMRIPLVFSKPGVRAVEPLGLEDVNTLLRALALGQRVELTPPADKYAFHFIGRLDTPVLIGATEADGRRVVLDLQNLDVTFADLGKKLSYKEAMNDALLAPRLRRLINHWEAKRWRTHLATEAGIPARAGR